MWRWLTRWFVLVPKPMPFVVGVGRSGTTLLRLMLDAHPLLAIPHETGFVPLAAKFAGTGSDMLESFFHAVTTFPCWPDLKIDDGDFREALLALKPFSARDGVRCFYRLYARNHDKPRWGDKTPTYIEQLETIQGLLPEAYFIHILRDGRDVALSFRGLKFSPGDTIETQARYWKDSILKGRDQASRCQHYLELRYEDLIAEPERELRRVCQFIGLDFHTRMLQYHVTARDRLSEAQTRMNPDGSIYVTQEQRLFVQRRTSEPPDLSRTQRWRKEMTAAEIDQYEAIAGDLLQSLGYAVSGTHGVIAP